jgi:hypothetical protein
MGHKGRKSDSLNRTVKVDPLPGALSTSICAPWESMIHYAFWSPWLRPAFPPVERSAVDPVLGLRRRSLKATRSERVYLSGSSSLTMRSAATFLISCMIPDGQWISTRSAILLAPKPKCVGPALEEAYPAAKEA